MCFLDIDCVGQGNCTTCSNFVCSAKCGTACGSNDEFFGQNTGCGLCKNSKCQPSDQCGVACSSNNGCAGNCSRCADHLCAKGQDCGAKCSVDTDCNQGDPNCQYCVGGACGKPKKTRK